jgi:hypothetical protein
MIMHRTGTARGAVFYTGDDGKKYQLRQVDREYKGKAKPPKYYLERLEGAKAIYLSGLFPTHDETLYSCDLKDRLTGMRLMYNVIFTDGGEAVRLEPKKDKTA